MTADVQGVGEDANVEFPAQEHSLHKPPAQFRTRCNSGIQHPVAGKLMLS